MADDPKPPDAPAPTPEEIAAEAARKAAYIARFKGKQNIFQPGVSGNPGGRLKGSAGLATIIRRRTKNGRELVDFAMKVLRGAPVPAIDRDGNEVPGAKPHKPSMRDRLAALEWLTERAFGKAPQEIRLTGEDGGPIRAEIEAQVGDGAASADDAERIAGILDVLRRVGALPPIVGPRAADAVVDAEVVEVRQADANAAAGGVPPAPAR